MCSSDLYYRARYYDPVTGRFISEDPIGFGAGDTHLYLYVYGDPVNLVDPFGLAALAPDSVFRGQRTAATTAEGFILGAIERCLFGFVASGLSIVAAQAVGLIPRNIEVTAAPCLLIPNVLAAASDDISDEDTTASGSAGSGQGERRKPKPDSSADANDPFDDPDSLTGLSPEEVKDLIPKDYTREPSRSGGGERFADPKRLGDQIRIMPGNPGNTDPAMNPVKRGPHAYVSRGGKKSGPIPLKGNPTLK